jgi:hypothetical protein
VKNFQSPIFSPSSSLESLNKNALHDSDEIFSPFQRTKLEATNPLFEALDITPLKIKEKSSHARTLDYLEKKVSNIESTSIIIFWQ